MKRTKLRDRETPNYTKGEEIMNMVTHIVGGAVGVVALFSCLIKAARFRGWIDVVGAIIYGVSMILLYTMSSVYHGLRPSMGKKVLQVLDHCTIYLLIAGSYTPILLSAIMPNYFGVGLGLFIAEWALAAFAITLTAIDWEKYNVFSMICYIGMGWGIIFFIPQTLSSLGQTGFYLLLAGGISYTVGAILYGIGNKHRWFHSVFHIFVVLGSVLHYISIFFYAI